MSSGMRGANRFGMIFACIVFVVLMGVVNLIDFLWHGAKPPIYEVPAILGVLFLFWLFAHVDDVDERLDKIEERLKAIENERR